MKMSSGTKILNKIIYLVSTSSLLGDKHSNLIPGQTCPHLSLPNQLPGYRLDTFRYQSFLRQIFLQLYSSCISGEFSWFFANSIYCIHKYISIYSLQGFSGDKNWNIFSILWESQGLSMERYGEPCAVYYITLTDIHLDFDGLSLASVRNTKFKPKQSKNCLKKTLITMKMFLKNQNNYVYTR